MSLQCGMSSRCLSKALQKIHSFDALVILASCDNIIAGAYLAAMRLNIPCIVVTGGPMYQGSCDGRKIVQAEVDIASIRGDEEILKMAEEFGCPSFGACPFYGHSKHHADSWRAA